MTLRADAAEAERAGPGSPRPPRQVLADLWHLAGLDPAALDHAQLSGAEPALPSSFAVGTAAQCSLAASALAAAELRHARGQPRQMLRVDMHEAAAECEGWFSIDGVVPPLWDPISGLYPCGRGGWVRLHANFRHHRDGALRLLGLAESDASTREQVRQALAHWHATDFEHAASDAGMVVAALRSIAEWDAHPQGRADAALPLIEFERIGDAPPLPLPPLQADEAPCQGLRVLDLTRVLAGPVAGRTLAAHGADVMLVNGPHLPNIPSIAETSRGKLSAQVDLRGSAGRERLAALIRGSRVMIQGYRPGALAARGFEPAAMAALRPGLVTVSLSAYGRTGPWAARRGFDSLVQTATGFNRAEADAAGGGEPRALPVQILDHATGFLIAFAAQAALLRQAREGGSWHVRLALARTGLWLRSLGRVPDGLAGTRPAREPLLETSTSGFGQLVAIRHSARLSQTPCQWRRPSMPPGSHPPQWP